MTFVVADGAPTDKISEDTRERAANASVPA